MEKILVIDNYDSFTWNLIHYLEAISGEMPVVLRNDEATPEVCRAYPKIVLSPGPGLPRESGKLMQIVEHCYTGSAILGICLGMQAIAEFFGARLQNLEQPFHGVGSKIKRLPADEPLYAEIPEEFIAGRYHSWVPDLNTLPDEIIATALDEQGRCMSLKHRSLPLTGVQFHPESVLTPLGFKMIENFVHLY